MVLVVVTVAAAVVVGRLRGGRFANLSTASLRGGLLAVGAAVAQFLHAISPHPGAAVALTGISQAALLAFLWCNRYVAGVFLAAVGSLMNTAVIVANGAMPVSRDAIMLVSRHPDELGGGRHRLLTDGDALPWLADIIGLPLLRTVISVGDVVLAAGIALVVIDLMQQAPPAVAPATAPVHARVSRAARRRSR